MTVNTIFYRDLAYVFVAAVLGGVTARKLRQPPILGYVVAGMLIGPFTPGPTVSDTHALELFAEIGVILLMYSIGLEFSFRDLMKVKWVAIIGAPLSVLLSVVLGIGVGQLLGWGTAQGIAVGAIVSVASTMVMMRMLMDRGDLRSQYGRVLIGITLCEDLLVVIMTVLIPNLVNFSRSHLLSVSAMIGKAILLIAPLTFVAVKLVPALMRRVARTRSQELYILVALALGFATAATTQAIGLSLALGAFLAGMVISDSEYSHETLAQLLPIRDSFVALFFVTIGALINPRTLVSNPALLAAIVGMIVLGKLAIGTLVVRLFRYPFWTALMVGVGITQIGEFSYVLVQVARNSQVVGNDIYNATLAGSLISILINAALMKFAPDWIGRRMLAEKAAGLHDASAQTSSLSGHVVLCGYGRVGGAVGTALETFGVPHVVIEIDPDLVAAIRRRKIQCVFGDPAHRTILEQAGVESANLVVITLPGGEHSLLAVGAVRALNPDVPILARAHLLQEQKQLLNTGATEVVQPEVEASAAMIHDALRSLHLPEQNALAYLDSFRKAMEAGERRTTAGQIELPAVQEIEVKSDEKDRSWPSLQEAHVRERFGVTVLAVTRHSGEVILNPPAETRIHIGDRLRVFGLQKQVQDFGDSLAQK